MTDIELLTILRDSAKKQMEMKALLDALVEDYAELISSTDRLIKVIIEKIHQRAVQMILDSGV